METDMGHFINSFLFHLFYTHTEMHLQNRCVCYSTLTEILTSCISGSKKAGQHLYDSLRSIYLMTFGGVALVPNDLWRCGFGA